MAGLAAAKSRRPKSDAAFSVAIFCADPRQCQSLTRAIRENAATVVVGIRVDADALFELIDRVRPDAVLVDSPSHEFLVNWSRRRTQTALSVLLENAEGQEAIDALDAGAQAILLRSAPTADIVTAIKALASGYAVLPRALLSHLPEGRPIDHSRNGHDSHRTQLTPRELEVLAALANGASNKAIARQLGISFHTVKFHIAALLAKLDAETRTEAVARAAQLGLVML